MTDTSEEPTVTPTVEPVLEPSVDTKKQARLAQLASARESAKKKKRQRDEDVSTMKQQLDKLTSLLETKTTKPEPTPEPKEEEEEPQQPVKKRKVVVTKQSEEQTQVVQQEPSFMQNAFRGGLLVALAGASWYVQNIMGKPPPSTTPQPKETKTKTSKPQVVQSWPSSNTVKRPVGKSGFMV